MAYYSLRCASILATVYDVQGEYQINEKKLCRMLLSVYPLQSYMRDHLKNKLFDEDINWLPNLYFNVFNQKEEGKRIYVVSNVKYKDDDLSLLANIKEISSDYVIRMCHLMTLKKFIEAEKEEVSA